VAAAQALPFSNDLISLAAVVALVVVFGHLGVRVLQMTDAEWDGVRRMPAQPESARV
jgi:hypothetical protein